MIERRKFLGSLAASLILSSCKEIPFIFQRESSAKRTERNTPESGDVLVLNGKQYLIRGNSLYPIPDLERYKKATKMDEYGRKVFKASGTNGYSIVEMQKQKSEFGIVDPFTGDFKDDKSFGGEINIYFGGFMTDQDINIDLDASETFKKIRTKLEVNNWLPWDDLFFTYRDKNSFLGGEDDKRYKASDTGRHLNVNIEIASNYFNKLKELFPLVQFNLIGHSLGGIFATEVARGNPDAVNNLILINTPVRGVNRFSDKAALISAALLPVAGDQKVTNDLFDRWQNKTYQDSLSDFSNSFVSEGRKITIIRSEDDPFVSEESAYLPMAKFMTLLKSESSIGFLNAHGRPLKEEIVFDIILKQLGRNLSRIN